MDKRIDNKTKDMLMSALDNCDLEYINSILEDSGEQEYENNDPECLFSVLMSFFK